MLRRRPRGVRGVRAVRVEAQAKINLRLRILARETSGFHQLETLFLRIALSDSVRVRRTDGVRSLDVTGVDETTIGPVEQNLAWRAAAAYFDARGESGGFAIELVKRIPIGGGLGGGSADAGAVLRALDATSPAPVGEAALIQIAATLGSDVPFLASDRPYALAWGRGERLLALRPPASRDLVLVQPPFGVNTADAYRWLADSRANAAAAPDDAPLLESRRLGEWKTIRRIATNDFEGVVAVRYPVIASTLATLRRAGAPVALLSGSGSTMFAVDVAASEVESPGMRLVVTRTATRVEPVVSAE